MLWLLAIICNLYLPIPWLAFSSFQRPIPAVSPMRMGWISCSPLAFFRGSWQSKHMVGAHIWRCLSPEPVRQLTPAHWRESLPALGSLLSTWPKSVENFYKNVFEPKRGYAWKHKSDLNGLRKMLPRMVVCSFSAFGIQEGMWGGYTRVEESNPGTGLQDS